MSSFDRFRESVSEYVTTTLHYLGFIEPKDTEQNDRTRESEAFFNSFMNKVAGVIALAALKMALISTTFGLFP